jgi:hypothetical protein
MTVVVTSSPQMVTQTYWDQKAEQAEERRRQRQEQLQQEQQIQTELPTENETENAPVENDPVAPEPSAVGMGTEPAVAEPQMAMAASTHEAEALKTVDVEQGGEGPSPKMDKRKWTPENVSFLDDVDSKDGPHPTIHQDIAQPAQYEEGVFKDDGRFEQTDAVLEKQDVEKSSNPTDGGGPATSTWPNKGQADPVTSKTAADDDSEDEPDYVCPTCHGESAREGYGDCPTCGGTGKNPHTSAVDPDKNPIAEFLEEEEAQRAISDFNQEG